ncbi:GGDEF domain-containing protein [Oxalicibacterium faecigallinarum]|uniref:diguanylate cyclase n=1 Tax=Oxalicibacterium faecigallinarum TaxID=573741 RepID=A0A8J3F4M6_9BURK|nr:GGDEF domain-containing protein [Oxalicibacterium faecigallinarum]
MPAAVVLERRRPDDGATLKKQQAARIARLTMTGLFAGLYLGVLWVFYLLDQIELRVIQLAAVLTCVSYLVFYLLFVSGLNLKSSARNLRTPMTVAAVGIMLLVHYQAPATQMAFIPFLLLTMAFVMHRMPSKTMLNLSLVTLLAYALVIYAHYRQKIDPDLLMMEMMQFVGLTFALPGFVMLADRVQRLHSALYKANRKIRDIEEDAQRDEMLGCYNRRYIVAALEQQKRLADETGEPLCLAVIDLDHFKRINDDAGHLIGDDVLRDFSRIAQRSIRQEDVFGRYGGEEFLLILPQTSLHAASHIAERIRVQVECYDWNPALRNGVTVSIGLTQHIPGESVLDLFSRTDSAMYTAKQTGRNRVVKEEPLSP